MSLLRFATLFLLVILSCAPSRAASPLSELEPAQRPRLKSVYSTIHDLTEFTKGDTRAVVVVFLGTECPVSLQYVPRLNELSEEFRAQNIKFLGVYPDVGVNLHEMATHSHDADIVFPVFKDVDLHLADWLGAQVVPEVVVLDKDLKKVYQGAIDDQYKRGGRRAEANDEYLHDALAALLGGKEVETEYIPASGCPIERTVPARAPRDLSFHKDVEPIFQRHCQECHRDGGPGPFELLTFDDIAYNTEKIREVVIDRRMPPWHGFLNPKYGKIANDQSLTPEELETIVAWIDGGAKQGNAADAPPPVVWPAPEAWGIGQPDFVFKMNEPFRVPKTGIIEYQFFRVKLDYDDDRWFRGIEIKPGNREVVHHVTLHLAPSLRDDKFKGFASMAQLYGLSGENAHLINDYVPGDSYNAKVYPPHQAVKIPKHSDLIFEVHYTPNNREAVSDQSMVAFQWGAGTPAEEVLTRVFRKPTGRFKVPPYAGHYVVEDTYYFENDVVIEAIRPHMHLRGKKWRLERIERNPETDEIESRETILSVPIFDPGWQRTYELALPFVLPAGTELVATAVFDNTRLNPDNPDPSAEVVWGQQTTDEMFSTRFKYSLAKKPAGQEH
ncbi:MAG TPA: redoxin domain-containing protein [Pirellulaceae bacterium]|nr:redoxin domain-containing protein [Pirellulaceae bacterium]